MKTLNLIAVAAAVVTAASTLTSCSNAPKVDVQKPSSAEVDSVSYLIGINFGYFLKANNFADKLSDINMSLVKKGMTDFVNNKNKMGSEEFNAAFKINPDEMQTVFESYITKRNEYAAAVSKSEGEAFLEKIYDKGGVVKTESGLMYEILEAGNDVHPAEADTVWCQYKGTLVDGTEFDASDEASDPVEFTLDRVIKGWTEGLQLIGEGGHIKLYVPSDLAYGERGAGPMIKPNSTLIFDITLSKVGKKPAEAKAAK